MADGVEVKVRGLETSLAKLRRVAPALDAHLETPLRKSAEEVADLASRGAPRDTGKYAASIRAAPVDGEATFQDRNYVSPITGKRVSRFSPVKKLNVSETTVSASAAYGVFAEWIWHFLEFGTIKRPATPHLFPAFRILKKRITGRMRRAMNKAIREAMRK